jgi:hypothetical protein
LDGIERAIRSDTMRHRATAAEKAAGIDYDRLAADLRAMFLARYRPAWDTPASEVRCRVAESLRHDAGVYHYLGIPQPSEPELADMVESETAWAMGVDRGEWERAMDAWCPHRMARARQQ